MLRIHADSCVRQELWIEFFAKLTMHSVNITYFYTASSETGFREFVLLECHVLLERIIKSEDFKYSYPRRFWGFLTYKFCALTRFIWKKKEKKEGALANSPLFEPPSLTVLVPSLEGGLTFSQTYKEEGRREVIKHLPQENPSTICSHRTSSNLFVFHPRTYNHSIQLHLVCPPWEGRPANHLPG